MAVTQLDVLKIAVGMFAGAPSAKITKMLTEWKGDARSLFATIGESVYTKQVSDYKGLDAKAAAALLVQNLGGDTLTAEVKGWATDYVEKALANNKGNIGLVAYDAVNFLSTTEDANYAGVRKQLENRLEVAKAYVASTKGSEVSNFAILKNVTSNEVSRDKAIMDITGVDPSEVIIEGAIQLTNKADTPVLTAGDDIVQGLKGTLNSTDIIIDAQTSDKDFLKAVINSDNDNANPVIRRIETIEVDFKGFGLGLNTENIQDGTLKITSTQANNKSADITGLASLATQNLVLDVAKNITELDLNGEGAKVVLNGQDINITTAAITEMEIQSVDTASSVTTNYTGNLKVHGDQNLTIKDSNTATAANITNELAAGKVLTIEAQASSAAGADLSKAGAAVIALNKAADSSANRTLTFANNATVKLGADNALSGAGVITLSTAEMNNLNVEVNHAQTAQKVKVDQVGVLNFEVNGNPAKALSGLELTSTRGNTDNIKVTAGKSVAFSDVTTQSRSLNVTVDAATTFANIKTSANAASGAATFTINAATKVTDTSTGLELENKVANFTIHADTEIAQFKGTNTNKTTWSFSGDKNIKLGNGNFSVGRATLNFADTAGEVSIASLTTAGTTGVTVLGGQGNLTAQGSTGNDSMFGGAGNDLLNGGSGNDSLVGGAGNDTLVAGAGTDTLEGGAGNDVFVLGVGTVVNDYKFGEDRVVLTGAEASGNSFKEVKQAADGSIGGVSLGAEVNGKAHTELLQFGFDEGSNAFTLDDGTTGFVGSDHGDFVKGASSPAGAFSVRLGKGDDYLALATDGQAATIVFEDNAANNGKDTIIGFNVSEDKLNFNKFLGDGYKVVKTDGTDLAGGTAMATGGTSGAFDLTDSTNANININISGKVAAVVTSQSELVSLKAENIILKAFTNGEFQVGADKKAVVILTAGNTASVAYVENNSDAAITANEITIVGMVESTTAWSTATPATVGV